MSYNFQKVATQQNYLRALGKVHSVLDIYRHGLDAYAKVRSDFLGEVLSVKVGDSLPLGMGWSAYITH